MATFQHLQNIGDEGLMKEYKELVLSTLPPTLLIDSSSADELLRSGQWIFNDTVLLNLERYLQQYIPKYTVAFMDPLTGGTEADLYIGIDDFGNVQGIPFQGLLDYDLITSKIQEIINNTVFPEGCRKDILDNITVKIIPVNNVTAPPETELIPDFYKSYLDLKQDYAIKEKTYLMDSKKWTDLMMFYQQKLVDSFNLEPMRSMLYDYIQKTDPENCVLELIKSGYQINALSHEEITKVKENPYEPFYWVCRWKDENISYIKLQKPQPTHRNDVVKMLSPINILTKVSLMVPYWIKNNYNMNLFVIRINFNHRSPVPLCYFDGEKTIRCYRTIYADRPCCIPID